jgi:hypothetical protein
MRCHDVRTWISTGQGTPPPDVVMHVASCALCRGALLTLTAQRVASPSISCDTCQADLAQFIDLEREDELRAAQTYPAIWWHLLLCWDCAEVYAAVRRGES